MSDHLPECLFGEVDWTGPNGYCICDRLRACEQRVLADVLPDVRRIAYDHGLDDARDAVAACVAEPSAPEGLVYVSDALAAIDALTKEGL